MALQLALLRPRQVTNESPLDVPFANLCLGNATSCDIPTKVNPKHKEKSSWFNNSSRFHALVSGPNVVHTFKVAKRETKHGTWKTFNSFNLKKDQAQRGSWIQAKWDKSDFKGAVYLPNMLSNATTSPSKSDLVTDLKATALQCPSILLLQIHVFHCNSEMKCPVKSCYTRNPGSSIENLILHILQNSPRTHQAQLCTKLVALQSARTLRKSACMQWKSMESAPFQPQQAELHTACLLLTFVPFFASANRQRFVESSFARKLAKWPTCAVPLISAPLQTASPRA